MKNIYLKIKSILEIASNIKDVFSESIRFPKLKIFFLMILGCLTVVFESIGIAMLIPIIQNVVQGVGGKTRLPAEFLKPLEDWLNQWQGFEQIAIISLFIIISGAISSVLTVVKTLADESISLHVSNYWRKKLFRNILLANVVEVFKHRIGNIQNLIVVECGNIRFLYRGLIQLCVSLAMACVYVFVLILISLKLTVLVIFLLAISSIPVFYLIKYIQHTSFNRAQSRSFLGSIIVEIFSSIKIVHLFKTFDYETGRFGKAVNSVMDKEWQMLKRNSLVGPINNMIVLILPLIIIFLGLRVSQQMGSNPVWVLLFIVIFSRLAPVTQKIITSISTMSQVYGSVIFLKDSMREFHGTGIESGKNKIIAPPKEIVFKDVSFGYNKDTPIIKNINFTIRSGAHVAFIGPSGSGKSTIINLMIRLFDPDSGSVEIDGVDLKSYNIYDWRHILGLVDQNATLFNENIRYNIAYGLDDVPMEKVINSARLANACDFIEKFPDKYNTQVGVMGHSISGGQRQRVAIARAICRDPEILILDEATSSIDLESERLISETISSIKMQGKTIINISHRLSSVRDADTIYFIDEGEIKASGTIQQLLDRSETFRQYLKLQNIEI